MFIDYFKRGYIDIAYFSPGAYVFVAEKTPLKPILIQIQDNGKLTYKADIYINKNSGINTIDQLKGKRISFVNKNSVSGYQFPKALLIKQGISNFESCFKNVSFLESHEKIIDSLLNGYIDAGATYFGALDRAKKLGKDTDMLKSLISTEEIPSNCIAARYDLDLAKVEVIKNKFATFHKDDMLKKIRSKGFQEYNDTLFDPVRETIKLLGNDY